MKDSTYQFGEFHLDGRRFQLLRNSEPLRLEKKPMELLLLLAASEGRLVTRAEIATHLWGEQVFVDTEHGINTAIRKVRAVLGETPENPRFLFTVPGMGYRLLASAVLVDNPAKLQPAAKADVAVSGPAVLAEITPEAPREPVAASMPSAPARWRFPGGWALGRPFSFAAAGLVAVVALLVLVGHLRAHAVATVRLAAGGPGRGVSNGNTAAALPEEARIQYQRGLSLYDRRNAIGSAAAFRRAIELAPNYGPAYAGLAHALDSQAKLTDGVPGAYVPEALQAANKAIALDPAGADGYLALGTLQTTFTWQWNDAERNMTRGLSLDPQNAVGRIWYAVLLQLTGREDQAVEQARLAVEAAPLSFFMLRMQGSILFYAHRYEEAMSPLERAQEIAPSHPNVVDNWMSMVDEQQGLYDDAVRHDLLLLQQRTTAADLSKLRVAYKLRGWQGYWQTRLQQMHPESMHGCALYHASLAYLRVGDRNYSLDFLRRAAEQHCFFLAMVHVDPNLTSLRGDPRFIEIERIVDSNWDRAATQQMARAEANGPPSGR